MLISLLIPTKDRPHNVERLVESITETASGRHELELLFYVDKDDKATRTTLNSLEASLPDHITLQHMCDPEGDAKQYNRWWNYLWEHAKGEIFQQSADDVVYRTFGWDDAVVKTFEKYDDRMVLVFCDDGHKHSSHAFLSREWCDLLGYFIPGIFDGGFNDIWNSEIAHVLRRRVFVAEHRMEHMHQAFGKAPNDDVYKKQSARTREQGARVVYYKIENESRRYADIKKIQDYINKKGGGEKQFNVGMIGLGKLGLPVSLAISYRGHKVRGYDLNETIKGYIDDKHLPYKEHGVFQSGDLNRMFKYCDVEWSSVEDIVKESDIIFVSVQTPHDAECEGITRLPETRKDFDYTYLKSAVKSLSDEIAKQGKDKVVVIISTVLPGTLQREIIPLLSDKVKLCYNPFFIAMGTTVVDFYWPEFILFGVVDEEAAELATKFYRTINGAPFHKVTLEEAEATKVFYNTFIGAKISFTNTVMEICHKMPNVNCDNVIAGLKLAKKRLISPAYMNGGMGDGGGCHPRDNNALSWLAKKLNLSHNLFEDLMVCRENQTQWLAELVAEEHKNNKLPIVILGRSYKPESNLTVGSPAILLQNLLEEMGLKVESYDPYINEPRYFSDEPRIYFVATKHPDFINFKCRKGSIILDPWRYVKERPGVKVIHIGK